MYNILKSNDKRLIYKFANLILLIWKVLYLININYLFLTYLFLFKE